MRKLKPIWYAEKGFSHNPFSIKPAIVNDQIIGNAQAIDSIYKVVEAGQIGLVVGDFGVGKTTFMKSIIKKYGGQKRVVYFACNRLQGKLDLDKLLHERLGIVGKLLKIKSRNLILLLDEADHLTKEDFKEIKSYHRKGYFRSVVIVTHDVEHLDVPRAFLRKVEVCHLEMLRKEEAVAMAQGRLAGSSFLPPKIIEEIYARSGTPRIFLKNCEDACRWAFEHKHRRVTKKDVKDALAA